MSDVLLFTLHAVNLAAVPLLLVGVMRKVKALMQNRIGPSVLQPFYDTAKLLRKGETISDTASAVFVWAPRLGLAVALAAAVLVPWAGLPLPPSFAPATNFVLVLYLLGLGKFFSLLAAMDTGSAFGGLGASREATLSVLVEPTMVMGLGALALSAGSMELAAIFGGPVSPFVAALSGMAFVFAALAELSRMPVDDPTTHLELTMVHEAMILENSGRNLALTELGVALRTGVFLGLAVQTLLRTGPSFFTLSPAAAYGIGIVAVFLLAAAVAAAEGVLVKLSWRRVPDFISFAAVLSIVSMLVAVARG